MCIRYVHPGCSGKSDIVFVIDSSGSIRRDRFGKVLDFVNRIVKEHSVQGDATRFGAVVFSDSASVMFQLNTYKTKQDVMAAISCIKFAGGRTNTAAGLQLMVGIYLVLMLAYLHVERIPRIAMALKHFIACIAVLMSSFSKRVSRVMTSMYVSASFKCFLSYRVRD